MSDEKPRVQHPLGATGATRRRVKRVTPAEARPGAHQVTEDQSRDGEPTGDRSAVSSVPFYPDGYVSPAPLQDVVGEVASTKRSKDRPDTPAEGGRPDDADGE